MEKLDELVYVGRNREMIKAMFGKINEIVDWINRHERIMVKDKDRLLAKLGEIEDRKSAATEK